MKILYQLAPVLKKVPVRLFEGKHGKRKRMLAYIKERDLNRYRDLVKKLKLRG